MRVKNKLRDLLIYGDRGVGHASGIAGVLSGLFQKILIEREIKPAKWDSLINDYAKAEVSHRDNRRDMASIRGNLNKEFLRPTMTWKVFCKAMMFLHVRRFKIIILAEHEDGKVTEHSAIVEANTVLKTPTDIQIPDGIQDNVISVDFNKG